jgi:hypothetical protein
LILFFSVLDSGPRFALSIGLSCGTGEPARWCRTRRIAVVRDPLG